MSPRGLHARFDYRRCVDQGLTKPAHHAVAIVGAGPVGLSLAVDLAQRGQNVVLLDDADRIGDGSRAICFSKRTLEIFDRLGVGECMMAKGVTWSKGRVFQGADLIYEFDLLPDGGHKRPAFINLQQYYVESYLIDRIAELPLVDLRWRNRVVAVDQRGDHAQATIETPDGPYKLTCDWLIACDGARSPVREMLGLEFPGETFEDQFLIADVKMAAEFPAERWFWFDPPFHSGKSALLHKQPDDLWRIDLQLAPDADSETEKKPANVISRISRMLGHPNFELQWVSVYRFQCRRIDRFVHGRAIFAGDAAHQLSPFGARGANSGIQDADNLGWKLDAVLRGEAPEMLIDSYNDERTEAADDNVRHSTRSTDFIAPHSAAETRFRNAALALSRHAEFAKRFVNPGRLSTATRYSRSPLSSIDAEPWTGGVGPGEALADAPLVDGRGKRRWLSDCVGPRFTWASLGGDQRAPDAVAHLAIAPEGEPSGSLRDAEGVFARRYGLTRGAGVLFRPDGHVAARFRHATSHSLAAAYARALRRA